MDERGIKALNRIKTRLEDTVRALNIYSKDKELIKIAVENLDAFNEAAKEINKQTTFTEIATHVQAILKNNLSYDEQSVLVGYLNALNDYNINITNNGV